MSKNPIDDEFLSMSDEKQERKIFHCTDGMSFNDFKKAYRHEMHIRITSFFPQSALVERRHFGKPDLYYFSKHVALKCGVYRVVMNCLRDLDIVEYFFRGVKEHFNYPDSEDAFPLEVDIEIYYESYPGALIDSAQWRFYEEDEHR